MLPMNKLMDDIAEFIKEREEKVLGTPVGHEDVQRQRDEVVLFANEMSDKYEEHVSVELVDTLMVSYQDSLDKENDERRENGTTEKNPVKDALDNIDDGVDFDTEGS
jgi:hypothetical protein